VYANQVLCDSPHLVQVETDDDEVGIAYYFFDDHYLARHGKHAAFLLNEGWKLPGGSAPGGFRPAELSTKEKPAGRGQGKTWCVDLDHVGDMDELSPAYRLDGVRVPDLARHLLGASLPEDTRWPLEELHDLLLIDGAGTPPLEQAFLQDLRQSPGDDAAWNAYSDLLHEQGERPAGLHLLGRALGRLGIWKDDEVWGETEGVDMRMNYRAQTGYTLPLIHSRLKPVVAVLDACREKAHVHAAVEEHVAQLCYRADYWSSRGCGIYHQLIFFDDRWAAARPDLANAILPYVWRWDVLSTSRTPSPKE
jgi:uncharacterized protein (TIGR02996 family)